MPVDPFGKDRRVTALLYDRRWWLLGDRQQRIFRMRLGLDKEHNLVHEPMIPKAIAETLGVSQQVVWRSIWHGIKKLRTHGF